MAGISLGCAGQYRAGIHLKGGRRLWSQCEPLLSAVWGRVLDDVSEAAVSVAKRDLSALCCGRIADTRPWGHELTVYRDDRLVWQGPVRKVVENRTTFTIYGRDVFSWLDRRVNTEPFTYTAMDMSRIASQLIAGVLSTNDINIVDYLRVADCGVIGSRAAPAMSVYVGAEIRELAAAGIDFTTLGRAIVISGELSSAAPRAVLLAGKDIIGEYEIERTGDEVTWAGVVGEGVAGFYGGSDAFLGRVDMLVKANGTIDVGSASAQAKALVTQRRAPVTVLRLPDDSWLSQAAPITIEDLLCGNRIDVVTGDDMCMLPNRHAMRIIRVSGTWTEGGERIGVSLAPFTSTAVVAGIAVSGVV